MFNDSFSFLFLLGLWFELRALHLQFALVVLEMESLESICPGWPRTLILPISAFQVARIPGVSHWCLVIFNNS
jgi:hypothetical protein